jgi:hypothetical protein
MRTVTGTFSATAQPVFDGTPDKTNCPGQSVSALAHQHGGLNGASEALGYRDVLRELKLTSDDFGFEIEIKCADRARQTMAYLRGGHQLLRPYLRRRKEDQLARWPQGARLSRQVQNTMNVV